MSDVMRQIPFGQLMDWVLDENKDDGTIFGLRAPYKHTAGKKLEIFGEKLETPFGPAAGPHTQLAQNIIASYLAGGRFFELKTVQKLDGHDLPVSKPCILAPDECYNVEWSTELYIPQALEEYIKGWYALKLICKELELGEPDGFVFNMSVGYDLEGIKLGKIDKYIEGMKNAAGTDIWKECQNWAADNLGKFKKVDRAYLEGISPVVSKSITLSTLHGCPPEEIERIAAYLLHEKKLHTFIKCNPTLLGYEYARDTLKNLGFEYITFDDHHFKADLQFSDAVPMLKRLQAQADGLGLEFGVKITNTFPVKITENQLPGEEMYMSGRSLFPLSIEAANMLTKEFNGKLRISYSGGADAHNIGKIFDSGIWPITLATTLLKPGGYQRMNQMAAELATKPYSKFESVKPGEVAKLADWARSDALYRKAAGQIPERKMSAEVPLVDCFVAPCRDGCPINQDIPAYLRLVGEGKHLEALRVITQRNPLPFITGTICSHGCMTKCTRSFYEESVHIRGVKLEAAQKAYSQLMSEIKTPTSADGKVAVVGGGAAGLAAAYFLAKAGRRVTVFEKRESFGGIVRHVIPAFRIEESAIENDVALVRALGVELKTKTEITSIDQLKKQGFEHVVIAVGAWKPGSLELEGGKTVGALEFLEQLREKPESVSLGENVIVIGGGNTAMDAARAARRVAGVKKVSLVYRRTKRYMPADAEELELAIADGVEFCELLSPLSFKGGNLVCEEMELGLSDASGRRSPKPTGRKTEIAASTIITAIGDLVDGGLLEKFGIAVNERGRAVLNSATLETNLPGVYLAGDVNKGPATVVEAIADAIKCAEAITGMPIESEAQNINPNKQSVLAKKGTLYTEQAAEFTRCLECATVCECCVDVCPNRANLSIMVKGRPQIVHVDYMCNECGNCEVFCPYSSAPYLDKLTLFANMEDFENSKNSGFVFVGSGVKVRVDGVISDGKECSNDIWDIIEAVRERDYLHLRMATALN